MDAQGSVSRWEGIPLGRAGVGIPLGVYTARTRRGAQGYPAGQGIPLDTLRVSR